MPAFNDNSGNPWPSPSIPTRPARIHLDPGQPIEDKHPALDPADVAEFLRVFGAMNAGAPAEDSPCGRVIAALERIVG